MHHGSTIFSAFVFGLFGLSLTALAQNGPVPATAPSTQPVLQSVQNFDYVTVRNGHLFDGDRPYRAIGVNVPHLHQAYFGTFLHLDKYGTKEAMRQAAVDAIQDAGRNNLQFIRFFAGVGYPMEAMQIYEKDKAEYWRLMDELMLLCRQNGIRLVPTLVGHPGLFQYFRENGRAMLDPKTKTGAFTRQYIREFVTRYKDDPTLLMWEIMNEGMLKADVEQEGRKLLPEQVFPEGFNARVDGTNEDTLNFRDLVAFYKEIAVLIKQLDPHQRPVTSGDSKVRDEVTSRRETFPNFKFKVDGFREWIGNNLAAQPEPLDVVSYHFYVNDEVANAKKPWPGMNLFDSTHVLVDATHAAGAPVFIGELGAGPNNAADVDSKFLLRSLDQYDEQGVDLIALWVWHFNWQPEYTMSSESHPAVVARAKAFNDKHATKP